MTQKARYRTYETDVAVIGGGVAGMFAARSIISQGKNAVVLDKGPFGHSGASGINWGHNMSDSFEKVTLDEETIKQFVTGYAMNHDGMVPQEYLVTLIKGSQEARAFEFAQKTGGILERKASDGTPNGEPVPETWLHTLYPHLVAQYITQKGVRILDHTMVLDILQDKDGAVAGVVALSLRDGEGVLIRCRAVVHAMGSPCWNYGWSGYGTKNSSGKECTGDGVALLMKKGIAYGNLEFQWPYWRNLKPDGVAYSQGIGIGGNEHATELRNKDGEYYYRTSEAWKDWPTLGTYWKVTFNQIFEGKYLEDDQNKYMMLDITHIEKPQHFMRFSRRTSEVLNRDMGYMIGNEIPMGVEYWESQELPELDGATLAVKGLPGCFIAKSSWGAFLGASAGGHVAGKNAALHAGKSARRAIDPEEVQRVLGHAYDLLDAEPENGIRANTLQHKIQNLVFSKIAYNRCEKNYLEAMEELARIEKEDLPRMFVPVKTTRANYEWRQALEVENEIIYAKAYVEGCMARKETRGTYIREDYKNMDNKGFLKHIFVKMDKEGRMSHYFAPVDDSYVSLQSMIENGTLPEIGAGEYPQPGTERVAAQKLGHG